MLHWWLVTIGVTHGHWWLGTGVNHWWFLVDFTPVTNHHSLICPIAHRSCQPSTVPTGDQRSDGSWAFQKLCTGRPANSINEQNRQWILTGTCDYACAKRAACVHDMLTFNNIHAALQTKHRNHGNKFIQSGMRWDMHRLSFARYCPTCATTECHQTLGVKSKLEPVLKARIRMITSTPKNDPIPVLFFVLHRHLIDPSMMCWFQICDPIPYRTMVSGRCLILGTSIEDWIFQHGDGKNKKWPWV